MIMINRSALAGLALLLVGGLVGLYFLVIKESPSAKSAPTPVATGSNGTSQPTGQGPTLPNAPTTGGTPQLPQHHTSTAADRDTTGLVLTDHRDPAGGSNVEIAPGTDTPPTRKLDPGVVRSVHRNAEPIMQQCARKVAASDRGPRARIGAHLKVAIEGGEMHVTDVQPFVQDLNGPEVAAVETCVRDMMMNFTAPTPDEADLDSYELHYQYVVK